jgi:hypothetical protein
MYARPQVREILISKKMRHWWAVAHSRLIAPSCPRIEGAEKLWRLCAKYPHIMTKLGLNEFSAFSLFSAS